MSRKALVLDTGALIAVDRHDREMLSVIETALQQGDWVLVPTGAIGQAWRDPSRQAVLSRTLNRCDEVALDGLRARAAGWLCGSTGTNDVIDASVVITAAESGQRTERVVLYTSDTRDMRVLTEALGITPNLIHV